MIIGIGHDICEIDRIAETLARHGERFLERTFTQTEIDYADSKPEHLRTATLAKRFAAKEAVLKAIGTGHAHGLYLKDIGVTNDEHGKPSITLHGKAKSALPANATIHISLSDTDTIASAYVIIEVLQNSEKRGIVRSND